MNTWIYIQCICLYVIRTVPCPHSVLWDLNYSQAQQLNEKALLVNERQSFSALWLKWAATITKEAEKNSRGRKPFSWSAIYVIRKRCPRCALNTGRPAQLPQRVEKISLIFRKDTITSVPLFIYIFAGLFIYSLFYPCMYSCFKGGSPRHSPLFFSLVSFFIFHTVGLSVPGKKIARKQFVARKWKRSTVFIYLNEFFINSDESDMPTHLTQPQQITIHSTAVASQISLWCVTQALFIFDWADSPWSAHCHASVCFIYTNNVFKRHQGS